MERELPKGWIEVELSELFLRLIMVLDYQLKAGNFRKRIYFLKLVTYQKLM